MVSTSQKKDIPLLAITMISIVLFLASCAYDKEFTYYSSQIAASNNRVTKLQESIDQEVNEKIKTQSEIINSNQAEVMADIDRLRGEIQELTGRIEDNEHIIKSIVERDLNKQDSINTDVDKLSDLIPRLENLERVVNSQNEYLGLESSFPQESVRGQIVPTLESQATVVEDHKPTEAEIYDLSLSLYREGKYEQALESFKSYMSEYSKSDLADNAQFWTGECLMALKQYEQAILAYQEVVKKYPSGNKVPNAMLRQAIAFLEINDKISSQLLLKKVIKQFPSSSEAQIAQRKLTTIK